MSDLPLPFLVPYGWERSVSIAHTGRNGYRLLFYPDGTVRFEHECDRGGCGVVICAPVLAIGTHRIVNADPITIEPSLCCPDCDTHGFIRNGRWVDA